MPIVSEWDTLAAYLSTNVGGKLKDTSSMYWDAPNTGATNETGFFGKGAGIIPITSASPLTCCIKSQGAFWAREEQDETFGLGRRLFYNSNQLVPMNPYKSGGLSVRCIKD